MSAPDAPLMRLAFDTDARSPRTVRRAFAECFAGHDGLEAIVLCLSEVVTNAVLHGGTGGTVVVSEIAEGLRIEVSDGSATLPQRRQFGESSPTGRGLHLLDRLTTRWGAESTSSGGKVVWFEVASRGAHE